MPTADEMKKRELARLIAEARQAERAAVVEHIASAVGERISNEFRGFWAREDLEETIPAMIREAGEPA